MLVLLVPGLGRTPISLFGLAAALRRAGHRTRFFGYSPILEGLPRIVDRLTNRLRGMAKRDGDVALIGHSLGGLLLRMALARVPELRVRHLIALGTPLHSPRMGRFAWGWLPFRLFARTCGRFLATPEEFDRLPALTMPWTAIVGTAGLCGRFSPFGNEMNDGIVAVGETRETAGRNAEVLLPVWHGVMMNAPAVREQIVSILNGEQ